VISLQAHPPPDVVRLTKTGIEAKYEVAAVIEEEKHEENGNETESETACRRSRQHRQLDFFRVPGNV